MSLKEKLALVVSSAKAEHGGDHTSASSVDRMATNNTSRSDEMLAVGGDSSPAGSSSPTSGSIRCAIVGAIKTLRVVL